MGFRRPTLNITILTLFLSFLFFTAGSLTWYNYVKNSEAAIEIANDLLSKVSEQIAGRIETLYDSTMGMANEVSELSDLAAKPEFMTHPAQWFLAETLQANLHIYSVYIGYTDGEFYQVISFPEEKSGLRQQLSAPDSAHFAVRRVFERPLDGRRVELWQFFDEERRLVGSRGMRFSGFDPRERPWFRQAIDQEGIVNTDFYIFQSTGSMGVTFARRFDGDVQGVFGVDLTLAGLCDYFASLKVGKTGFVLMFNKDLLITAHPDPNKIFVATETPEGRKDVRVSLKDMHDPLMAALARKIEGWKGTEENLVLDADGVRYLAHVGRVANPHMQTQYLAVLAPQSDFTGKIDSTREKSLLFAAAIILLAIPIAVYNARLISNPLKILAKEADKIRHFNLDSTVEVHSRIVEVADLSKAVKAMQTSLASFGRYVPNSLVRKLLANRECPALGGERRAATILFTDIADFTTISESMEAESLMLMISDYLQEVGSVILREGGTIDKYIGDAIMSFWNAPERQDDHAALACGAALDARRASESLNDRLRARDLPVLHTRFGVHTGNPIIGNVGSQDRMNYTAMGASVNLASRLEGLNKYYGTQILVSQTTRDQAGGAFIFRPVGKVMPKGTLSPITVHELLGRADDDARGELADLATTWERAYHLYQGQRFEEAAVIFGQRLETSPGDRLAATMLERARALAKSPPGEGWDGVDVFKTK